MQHPTSVYTTKSMDKEHLSILVKTSIKSKRFSPKFGYGFGICK